MGAGVQDGTTVKSPVAGHNNAVGIDADGIGRVMEIFFEGEITLPDGSTAPLAQLNSAQIRVNEIGVFNPMWGSYTRNRAVQGAARVTEVVVREGVVTAVRDAAGDDPIPDNGYVLVGPAAATRRPSAGSATAPTPG